MLCLYDEAKKLTEKSIPLNQLMATGIFSDMSRMKFDMGEGKTKDDFIKKIGDAVGGVLSANE